jgi:hypothetical protein
MAHITFIHGISNKPEREALRNLWLRALAREDGLDCDLDGITSSMVYWADVMYASPDTTVEAFEGTGNDELEAQRDAAPGVDAAEPAWRSQLPAEESEFVEAMADRLGTDLPDEVAPPNEATRGQGALHPAGITATEMEALDVLERVPLPWFIKRPLMKLLLRDVHHYLFNSSFAPRPGPPYAVQEEIRGRFLEAVREGAERDGPHLVISHSMGTVIAYDCLSRVRDCPEVDGFVTIGSPLGLDEIQDRLRQEWSRNDGFPARVRGRWINVYDPLDPVAGFDPRFANDFRRGGVAAVEDVEEANWGRWRHSITKYLNGSLLRGHVRELLAK